MANQTPGPGAIPTPTPTPGPTNSGSAPSTKVAADFDGDGASDIFLVASSSGAYNVNLSTAQAVGGGAQLSGTIGRRLKSVGVGYPEGSTRANLIGVVSSNRALKWLAVDPASGTTTDLFTFGRTSDKAIVGCHYNGALTPMILRSSAKTAYLSYLLDTASHRLSMPSGLLGVACGPPQNGASQIYILRQRGRVLELSGRNLDGSTALRAVRGKTRWTKPNLFVLPPSFSSTAGPLPGILVFDGRQRLLVVAGADRRWKTNPMSEIGATTRIGRLMTGVTTRGNFVGVQLSTSRFAAHEFPEGSL